MSKTIFYIGAGASFGKRDKDDNILEGIPIVSEIPKVFSLFRNFISDTEIPKGYIVFWDYYKKKAFDVERAKKDMLEDMDLLMKGIQEHATIDTYARKLYLTGRQRDFKKLKELLCAFFIWTQLEYKIDGRYDTFLANILEEGSLALPKDISIISWNYDSQIEMAYNAYNPNNSLIILEKNRQGEWPTHNNTGCVFKINGTASYVDSSIVSLIKDEERNLSPALQLIELYHRCHVGSYGLEIEFKTHVSFSWEDSVNQNNLIKSLRDTVSDTELVVVIGYSFPFFNRKMDRTILSSMPNLRKIYIQDINPSAVSQSIKAVLPTNKQVEIETINSCNQFCLPSEL